MLTGYIGEKMLSISKSTQSSLESSLSCEAFETTVTSESVWKQLQELPKWSEWDAIYESVKFKERHTFKTGGKVYIWFKGLPKHFPATIARCDENCVTVKIEFESKELVEIDSEKVELVMSSVLNISYKIEKLSDKILISRSFKYETKEKRKETQKEKELRIKFQTEEISQLQKGLWKKVTETQNSALEQLVKRALFAPDKSEGKSENKTESKSS